MDWNTSLAEHLGQTTALVRSGRLAEATQAIRQALTRKSGTAAPAAPPAAPASAPGLAAFLADAWAPAGTPAQGAAPLRTASSWRHPLAGEVQDAVPLARAPHPAAKAGKAPGPAGADSAYVHPAEAPGSFTRVALAHGGAQHHYWLYVPPGAPPGQPRPLVLMLHGCTQNPKDFATGTGMNQAAAESGALVLYPAQPRSANPKHCWNWFSPEHQRRGAGEPALLVAMVQDVAARHPVDARRIYAAGLSAGGAMAALLAREYPDVFAAVGVHSGLQAGAANNVMGALSAMNNGAKLPARGPAPASGAPHPAPALIVFHGDADATVSARNGEQLVEAALHGLGESSAAVQRQTLAGQSPAGQRYTRTIYRSSAGISPSAAGAAGAPGAAAAVVAEHWTLHGAGHAWSGGDARGSHTDARGIDATREMLRFFLEHPQLR